MEDKDTKKKGNITELEVMNYVTKLGYQVSIPFGDRARYDQIWDVEGKLLKSRSNHQHYQKVVLIWKYLVNPQTELMGK